MLAVVLAKRLTVLDQDERNRNKRNGQETKQTGSPANTKLVVHGPREQWETSTKRRSHKVVAGKDGCSILRVCVGEVVEDRVEQEDCAD